MPKAKISTEDVSVAIVALRGRRVILAADLARLYGVPTKRLNEQVRRNREKFPADFMFQLTQAEYDALQNSRSQIATLKRGSNLKYRPYAFTEHGALMAANVLHSARAVTMSVFIVRAFVQQRELLAANGAILKRLAEVDKTLLEHDAVLRDLYHKLLPLLKPPPDPPRPKIGFRESSPRYGVRSSARPTR